MGNDPNGPYKHYERPDQTRAGQEPPKSKWGIGITIIFIILIIAVPVAYHFASHSYRNTTEEPKEVQKAKSTKSSKVTHKSKSIKKKNTVKSANSKSSNVSSSTQIVQKTYLVKDGDTLTSIAQRHNMSVAQLAKLNNLSADSNIQAGQTLKLK